MSLFSFTLTDWIYGSGRTFFISFIVILIAIFAYFYTENWARYQGLKKEANRENYLCFGYFLLTLIVFLFWYLVLPRETELLSFFGILFAVTCYPLVTLGYFYLFKIVVRFLKEKAIAEANQLEEEAELEVTDLERILNQINCSDVLKHIIQTHLQNRDDLYKVSEYVKATKMMLSLLPSGEILTYGDTFTWNRYFRPRLQLCKDDEDPFIQMILPVKSYVYALRDTSFDTIIPNRLRVEHHHIVAGAGHGKTQCIQQMVADDLHEDCSIVVIDSQGDMINTIAPRIDPDRLILVDPETCPPALNLFSGQTTEQQISTTVELYEYIFSALEAQMTSKQQTAYRFVTRLLLVIPDSNIHTMREILEPGTKHQQYTQNLDVTAQSFFENEFNSRQFAETRSQILRRIYTILESTTLSKMLGATHSSLDVADAINSGKVLLISTAKSFLKQTGSSLFGRIFIAQVMQAVMERKGTRKRTYLYIDEFQDYAEDSFVLYNLFEQARKYNLALIVAHQYLGQLPPKLQQSISANTAIKFAGGVSSEDASKLASQMGEDKEFITSRKKGFFAGYFRGLGTAPYKVRFGYLERLEIKQDIRAIQQKMRKQYGAITYEQKPTEYLKVADVKQISKKLSDADIDEEGDY